MGGFDDQVAVMGGWMSPNPSPRSFFSMGDDINTRSILELPIENKTWSQEQITSRTSDEKDEELSGVAGEQKMNSRGGLLERMAARAGFNAPRLNTEGIRPSQLSLNTETRSPYMTIPPGLSPTSLLESPVFLSNSLAQASPTTGKFAFAMSGNGRNSIFGLEGSDKDKENFFEDNNTSSFAFKPFPDSAPSQFLGAANKAMPTFSQQCFSTLDVSVQPENFFQPRNNVEYQNGTIHHLQDFSRSHDGKDATHNVTEHPSPADEEQAEETDHRGVADYVVGGGAPSEDGYNWRKYGQKQVKGSDYPRSYYKCTHPNCPVKKKVERSHEGHITEIIYKGAHNHPKPPPSRRSAMGTSTFSANMQTDQTGSHVSGGTPEWGPDNLEVTSSQNPNSLQDQFGKGDVVDSATTFSNDEDDRGTHGSVSLGYDGEGDESESKRRRMEAYATEMSGATRAIREPRVVVQTTSEVDILDDGYRWRKYGQKVVKGNPNPRSYYKCTSAGCTVRKHVERASHDLKSVITTYEGKHNHDVPAARNSGNANNGMGPTGGVGGSSIPAHLQRPLPSQQLHNSMARFDGSSGLGSFGLPGRHQLGLGNGFGFGLNQPGLLANLAMAGLGPHQGKLPPFHPGFEQQGTIMNEMGFMLPKGEPKLEPMSELPLNLPSGSSSSVYQQIMGGRLHM